ncbi:hypothetical protein [Microcoleus sp. herbarium2]|uniref:hypothetical protein n=1 Tax=Microcoleus sp. herbarium2 TaxID=3055433 RepID=UPI002FD3CA2E
MNPGACILDAFAQLSTLNSQLSTLNNNSGATGIDIISLGKRHGAVSSISLGKRHGVL